MFVFYAKNDRNHHHAECYDRIQLAFLRERALAWLLDMVIMGIGYVMLLLLLRPLYSGSGVDTGVLFLLFPILAYFLYNVF